MVKIRPTDFRDIDEAQIGRHTPTLTTKTAAPALLKNVLIYFHRCIGLVNFNVLRQLGLKNQN